MAGTLLARKLRPEVEVYAGVEPMFCKDGKELQALPLLQVKRRTDAFLEIHLRPAGVQTGKQE